MNESVEQLRAYLRAADVALSRRTQPTRTPRQRQGDFEEAVAAHRSARAILEQLQGQRQPDADLITAIAPLHAETADLGIPCARKRSRASSSPSIGMRTLHIPHCTNICTDVSFFSPISHDPSMWTL